MRFPLSDRNRQPVSRARNFGVATQLIDESSMICDSFHSAALSRDRVPINRIPVAAACYPSRMDEDLDTPFARLRWARAKAGYESAEAFSGKAGLKGVTYRSYENGQVGFSKHAAHFAKLLGVTADWLIGGGPVPDNAETVLVRKRDSETVASDLDLVMVRDVDITYAMGDGSIVADYPDVGAVPFDRNFLRRLEVRDEDALFVCRGEGYSMEPTIYGGDMVMVDTRRNRITVHDKVWALVVAGAGLIKRVRPLPDGRLKIISDNPNLSDEIYDGEDVYIVGKVIFVGRSM